MKRISLISFFVLVAMMLLPNLEAQSIQELRNSRKFNRQDYEIPAYSNRYVMVDKLPDGSFLITPYEKMKYLLLPVSDASPVAYLDVKDIDNIMLSAEIHLAKTAEYYYIPVDIDQFKSAKELNIILNKVSENDLFWNYIKMVDNLSEFKSTSTILHHSVNNAANGRPLAFFYRNGKYHLYYQTNMYGNACENTAVGHSVSDDLLQWQNMPLLMPYNRKNIVVSAAPICSNDLSNKGKLHTMLFSSSDGSDFTQQYLARCTDEADRVEDILDAHFPDFDGHFRVFKVMKFPNTDNHILIGADMEKIQILFSDNLIDWMPLSDFKTELFKTASIENVELISLPVKNKNENKLTLIVSLKRADNIASTVYYMVANFDGKKFIPDASNNDFVKFDDGASLSMLTVLYPENANSNNLALGWLDNSVDKKMFGLNVYGNCNTLPLSLFLYENGGKYFLGANPYINLKSNSNLKSQVYSFKSKKIKEQTVIDDFVQNSAPAYNISFNIQKGDAKTVEFRMYNQKNEIVIFNFDLVRNQLVVDRKKSGIIPVNEFVEPDEPVAFDENKITNVRIVVDKNLLEVFLNDGRKVASYGINSANPFDTFSFIPHDGKCTVKNFSAIGYKY